MAETPKGKSFQTPSKQVQSPNLKPNNVSSLSNLLSPQTPQTISYPRRSARRALIGRDLSTVEEISTVNEKSIKNKVEKSDLKKVVKKIGAKTPRKSSVKCVKGVTAVSLETPKRLGVEDCAKTLNSNVNGEFGESPKLGRSRGIPRRKLEELDSVETPKPSSNEECTKTPQKKETDECREAPGLDTSRRTPKRKLRVLDSVEPDVLFSPTSPDLLDTKRKTRAATRTVNKTEKKSAKKATINLKEKNCKTRVYYKKVVYDGAEFEVGDDVYVKRREDAISDNEDPEVEECRMCFKSGMTVMVECDDCLGGFHLKCLKPPMKEVPEGDWICGFCEARKLGKNVEFPKPPEGKKRVRTLREKLLSSDLWAARIESMWKEVEGRYLFRGHWYIVPEETAPGRQAHNLRRELYLTNDFADIEMESILRHCYVKNPKEYAKCDNGGDDVYLCEYEYDIRWHSFKRLADIDKDAESDQDDDSDEDWTSCKFKDSDTDEDVECDEENVEKLKNRPAGSSNLAANSRKGHFFGLQKIGTKKILEHVRSHKQTELEKAKATLLLATLPKYLPCRTKEMGEITAFIRGAICDSQCLGRCLYIHGVPGTGKTMSVLSVMRSLRSEVDAGSIRPYCFVEVNGLKLASPENIYTVIYEALSGHRVGWKKALHLLNERFSDEKKIAKEDDRPCILLIDELDLLVTRNQSVLYNLLDWPTRANSRLIVIGIANTMDLPEKLLPRISSRMGIQRLCFGPYNYQQLQEIISSRLKGIDAFEKQAVEFASRKVAAISGDARRALEICRRAAEIADYRVKKQISTSNTNSAGQNLIGMRDIEAAIQEMFQAPHIQVMKSCSKLSKIFLTAMVHELYKTGMAETTFDKLAMTVSSFCSSNSEEFPGWDTLLKVGCNLGESRVILCEPGARHRLQKLQLNFPSDDVSFALKDSKEVPWLAKFL